MTTTPLWVPLVVAGLGVAGTISAGIWTQMRADKREDIRWRRDREREDQVAAREVAARAYEYRREAYVRFMTKWREKLVALLDAKEQQASGQWDRDPDPPDDYLVDLFETLIEVDSYGSDATSASAHAAYDALFALAFRGKELDYSVIEDFQRQMRSDLGIPDGPIT